MVETEFLTREEKRELVGRIAESDLFRRAPKLREFLIYVAGCTLENRPDDVRAQAIAEKVFHRKLEHYDGGDTIVRAEARNLRKRLENYFETEGAGEPYVVVMPKGGYSLAFRPRSEPETFPAFAPDDNSSPVVLAPSRIPGLDTRVANGLVEPVPTSRILPVVCICLGAIAIIATALAARWYPTRTQSSSDTAAKPGTLPFSALFDNHRDTFIVTSDTAFLKISELEGRQLTLNEYLVRAYPDVPNLSPPDLIRNLNWSEFTDAAETKIAGLIMARNAANLQRTFLRSGHQVELSNFKSQNIILLGSAVSNPWADLYASQLNFQFVWEKGQPIKLLNRSPHPGEAPVYPSERDKDPNRRYAQIAFLPNALSGKGSALLLAGTSAEATAAAGEFLLDDATLSKTLKKVGIDPQGPPRYWEILLRAKTFFGGATHSDVIGYRLHPYDSE